MKKPEFIQYDNLLNLGKGTGAMPVVLNVFGGIFICLGLWRALFYSISYLFIGVLGGCLLLAASAVVKATRLTAASAIYLARAKQYEFGTLNEPAPVRTSTPADKAEFPTHPVKEIGKHVELN